VQHWLKGTPADLQHLSRSPAWTWEQKLKPPTVDMLTELVESHFVESGRCFGWEQCLNHRRELVSKPSYSFLWSVYFRAHGTS